MAGPLLQLSIQQDELSEGRCILISFLSSCELHTKGAPVVDHATTRMCPGEALNAVFAGYEDVKPALGESWRVQANLRIALSCLGPVLRRACLVANTLGPCGACAYYEVGVTGPRAVDAPV